MSFDAPEATDGRPGTVKPRCRVRLGERQCGKQRKEDKVLVGLTVQCVTARAEDAENREVDEAGGISLDVREVQPYDLTQDESSIAFRSYGDGFQEALVIGVTDTGLDLGPGRGLEVEFEAQEDV